MRIFNLGSINIDCVYYVAALPKPGETVASLRCETFSGGKGFNQSCALALAGAQVHHVGAVGSDGKWLVDTLREKGVDVSSIQVSSEHPTGHAVILVNENGGNSIVVFPGANATISDEFAARALESAVAGDLLLCQNETSAVADAITAAKARGIRVALNPSPFNADILKLPLDLVDVFLVNEVEAAQLREAGKIGEKAVVVETLGASGVVSRAPGRADISIPSFKVNAVDTTAAGDTFTGYYLASIAAGLPEKDALLRATAAAAISVTRRGAAPSVPDAEEVAQFLKQSNSPLSFPCICKH